MQKFLLAVVFSVVGIACFAQIPAYVPATGLLAWYPFSGSAIDASGNGHNGTVVGATLTSDRFGNANSAYLFNGSSSEITTTFRPPTGNAARTISCWFKYNALLNLCGDKGECIAGYGGNNRGCYEACKNFSLEINYAGTPPEARIDGICILTQVASIADSSNNSWHFFAAVYDPSYGGFANIKIYLDGAFVTSTTAVYGGSTSVNTDTLSTFQIGAGHYDCQRFFDGAIDEIGVWNRALSESELFNLYQGTPMASSDSFSVYISNFCSNAEFTISPAHYSGLSSVRTRFGDGTTEMDTFSTSSGFSRFAHTYNYPGLYRIKHVLYDGGLPVDSVAYSYEFRFCNSLLIQYYSDVNGDCRYSPGLDFLVSQPVLTEVDSNGIPVDTISSASGFYYKAYGNPGDIYTFKAISYPRSLQTSCPVSGIIHDTLRTSGFSTTTRYIGMVCGTLPSFDLAVNTVVNATGTNDQSGDIYINNNASCNPVNAVATLSFSSKFTADYGSTYNMIPLPDSVTSNSVSWNLPAFTSTGSVPKKIWYAIYHNPLMGYLTSGDTVHTFFTIAPSSGDLDTVNNTQLQIQTVRDGCDPNEMAVNPVGCIPFTSGTTQFQYTIGFENTGNDTAFNISILDTLSNNLDLSTMRIVTASAVMNICELKNVSGRNMLQFDFPNINLLDSSHHGSCDGAVIFTINTLPGLAYSTNVDNRAGIYFDYNPVVMTNTVENVIGCSGTLNTLTKTNNDAEIYPNPAGNILTLKTPQNAYNSLSITNTIGQVIIQKEISGTQITVDVKTLPVGMYYITLRGENGSRTEKFVKE